MTKTVCSKNRRVLCGRKECEVCFPRSLLYYLESIGADSAFIRCTDKPDRAAIDLCKSSCFKCEFTCQNKGCIIASTPNNIRYCICKPCSSSLKTKSTEQFVNDSILVHGNRYSYIKVVYIHGKQKIIIICLVHGEFELTPQEHLSGGGCPKCGRISAANLRRYTLEEVKLKCFEVHGNTYIYDFSEYETLLSLIDVECTVCGNKFKQPMDRHINEKHGCTQCRYKTENLFTIYLRDTYPEYTIESLFDTKNIGYKRFDICIRELDLIIEVDGGLHFFDVPGWKSSADKQCKNDVYKMIKGIKTGHSIIRIPLEYIRYDKIDWKNDIKELIYKYEKPTVTYMCLGDEYDKHSNLLKKAYRMNDEELETLIL